MRITRSGLFSDLVGSAVDMTVQPASPLTTQDGGTLTIAARASTGASKNGGALSISAGDGSAAGGSIDVISGAGVTGGQFFFSAGAGTTTGGDFNVTGGEATDPAGQGGSLFLTAGNATGGGGATGGGITLLPGAGDTSGGALTVYSAMGATAALTVTDDGANTLMAMFGATPVARPTTAIAGAAFVVGAGVPVNSASTFGGYTLAKIAAALVAIGALT